MTSKSNPTAETRVLCALRGHALGEILSAPFQNLVPAFETQVPRPARPTSGKHESLTTTLLALFDALYLEEETSTSLKPFATQAETTFVSLLTSLSASSCWRGPHAAACSALGKGLGDGSVASCVIVQEPSNPVLGALLPFAFLPDPSQKDMVVAGKCASALSRHRQVTSAMGLWVGGMGSLFQELKANTSFSEDTPFLDDAARGALALQDVMEQQWSKKVLGNALETEGARALLLAQAKSATHPRDLLPPPGLDARKEPQRLVLTALLTSSLSLEECTVFVSETLRLAAHVDVLLPLICAVAGLHHGQAFIEELNCILESDDCFSRRTQALFNADVDKSVGKVSLVADEVQLLTPTKPAKETEAEDESVESRGLSVDKNGQLSFL
ncbi:MAG: hypothetical protein GY822_31100 [Deltaproteobacteria bacterium]|nr:hypothetical protein [Deltaproteobacteria bacterium]